MSEKYIKVKIRGTKKQITVRALIDSGCTISVIDSKLVKQLGLPKYRSASGINIEGKKSKGYLTSALLTLNGGTFTPTFVALPTVPDKVVLGVDFLQQYDIKIDWGKEKISIPDIYKKRRFRV